MQEGLFPKDALKHVLAGDEPDSASEGAESSSSSDDVTLASLVPTAPPLKAPQAHGKKTGRSFFWRSFFGVRLPNSREGFFLPGKLLRCFTFMLFKWIVWGWVKAKYASMLPVWLTFRTPNEVDKVTSKFIHMQLLLSYFFSASPLPECAWLNRWLNRCPLWSFIQEVCLLMGQPDLQMNCCHKEMRFTVSVFLLYTHPHR